MLDEARETWRILQARNVLVQLEMEFSYRGVSGLRVVEFKLLGAAERLSPRGNLLAFTQTKGHIAAPWNPLAFLCVPVSQAAG